MLNLFTIDSSITKDVIISGIQNNSKNIKKGDLFVAIKGSSKNGVNFINEAIDSGASAVLTSDKTLNSSDYKVPIIFDENPRKKLSEISKLFFPNTPEIICGVTGTNGKTSTVDFLYQIWTLLDINAARIGTLGVKSKEFNFETKNTTPDPIDLHKIINNLSLSGVSHLALEVSSHAIDQCRINSIDFNSACFTNLSLDHLDYHNSLENYSNVKFSLFKNILPMDRASVICTESKEGKDFSKALKLLNKKTMEIGKNSEFINIESVKKYDSGNEVEITFQGEPFKFILGFAPYFQILNILCAAGLAIVSGCNYKEVFSVLEKIEPVKGRYEIIKSNNYSNIIIDYAHTPEALSYVLRDIKKESKGKVVLVFGCGGSRDQSKRPLMGRVAEKYCDEIIITNDNPRDEDPSLIADQILKGCPKARVILDRAEAIKCGISKIKNNDVLLIAGKGHEETQTIGNHINPFSDRDVIRSFCEASNE